ncbi:MAG TPA: hypothetical protein VFB97_00340 [Bacteroidales bacterium]|nr:hypothetical protein [Bacteroidales bacterium]
MKKTLILMMAAFLASSINGFSMDKNHKTTQSAKTEQHSGRSAKAGRRPPKARAGRKIHKSKTKRPVKKSTGNKILL